MLSPRLETSPLSGLRVLKALDFEVLEFLLCIATWLCPLLSATDCPLICLCVFLDYLYVFSRMPKCTPLSVCLSLRAQLLCCLVNLCVLPCPPMRASLSTSVCSLVDLCVLSCRSLSMFGRASSWALDVKLPLVNGLLLYCQTKGDPV